MFKCKICNKPFTNKQRLETHEFRCNNSDILSLYSSNSLSPSDLRRRERRNSNSSAIISEIEFIEKSASMKPIKFRTPELKHRKEIIITPTATELLEKEVKISALLSERNSLLERISLLTEDHHREQKKLKEDYTNRIELYKQKVESKYSNTVSDYIKKCKDSIEQYKNEVENLKIENKKFLDSIEHCRLLYNDCTVQLDKATKEKQALSEENRKLVSERDYIVEKLRGEKNREIMNAVSKVESELATSKSLFEALKKQYDSLVDNHEKEKTDIKIKYEKQICEMVNQLEFQKNMYETKIKELNDMFHGNLLTSENKLKVAVDYSMKKYEDRISSIKQGYENVIDALKMTHEKDIENIKVEYEKSKREIDYHRKVNTDLLKLKEEDMLKQFQAIIDRIEFDRKREKEEYEKKIEEYEKKLEDPNIPKLNIYHKIHRDKQ